MCRMQIHPLRPSKPGQQTLNMTGFTERLRENLYAVAAWRVNSIWLVLMNLQCWHNRQKFTLTPTACTVAQSHVPNLLFRFRRWRGHSQRVRLWREDPSGGDPSLSERCSQN